METDKEFIYEMFNSDLIVLALGQWYCCGFVEEGTYFLLLLNGLK